MISCKGSQGTRTGIVDHACQWKSMADVVPWGSRGRSRGGDGCGLLVWWIAMLSLHLDLDPHRSALSSSLSVAISLSPTIYLLVSFTFSFSLRVLSFSFTSLRIGHRQCYSCTDGAFSGCDIGCEFPQCHSGKETTHETVATSSSPQVRFSQQEHSRLT